MGKLLPILMLLVGVGAGIGAGIVLAPPAPSGSASGDGAEPVSEAGHDETNNADHGDKTSEDAQHDTPKGASGAQGDGHGESDRDLDYVKLNNQFVVPVVGADRVEALVVITLSIEAEPVLRDAIFAREPKVRDAFLQVLFDHSNMGGFQGAFTRANNLDVLRTALTEVAQREFGAGIYNVLIIDIARQDV